ncbi:flavin monoamine oxidase family protein [Luteococcus sp. Sow4_B9]|uniref:flavin monoamine oxidase family protein n=1 Tax=Luteococcus sp. Sow4_B9 TaxID=3438792 RepID=UPI003F94AFC5
MLDVAVVGAGLAGLSAAVKLVEAGQDIVVLEARSRVGGRLENVVEHGTVLEMGGQWVSPTHERVLGLAHEFGLQLADPAEGAAVVRVSGSSRQVPTSNDIEDHLTPFEMADLGQGLMRFRRLAERVAKDAAWCSANTRWLEQAVATWASTNLRTPGARDWFDRVFESSMGRSAEDSTLIEGLRKVNDGVDMEALISLNGGAHQQRVVGGAALICERLAEKLGEQVRLGAVVTKVAQSDESVVLTLADGSTVEAREAITTLPPRLLEKVDFEPALPQWRADAASQIPPGNVIKAALVYESPWWRRAGLSGQLGSDQGVMRVILDNSNPEDKQGVLMGFFEGAESSGVGQRSAFLRQRAMEETVKAAFGADAPEPLGYIDRDWSREEFTGGCHGAHFAPGVWTSTGPSLAAPEGRVHFAGAEYANRYNGYMEGAVLSGEQVAAQLLD